MKLMHLISPYGVTSLLGMIGFRMDKFWIKNLEPILCESVLDFWRWEPNRFCDHLEN